MEEALRDLGDALAIHREIGNRRGEGVVLGCLGVLHMEQGRLGQAREALAAGEALFRGINDRWELGVLRCGRGEYERLAGDIPASQRLLAQAEALAHGLPVGPDSDLGQRIAKLGAALNASAIPSTAPPLRT